MADSLKAQVRARLRLKRNGVTLYDEIFNTGDEDFTEYTQQRVVLGTSSGAQVFNMGGMSSGKKLLIVTDRVIKVSINNVLWALPVSSMLELTSSGITAIWLENESTTFQATVTVAVVE